MNNWSVTNLGCDPELDLRTFEYWIVEAVERSRDGCLVAAGLYMGHAHSWLERLPRTEVRSRALMLYWATLEAFLVIERAGRDLLPTASCESIAVDG